MNTKFVRCFVLACATAMIALSTGCGSGNTRGGVPCTADVRPAVSVSVYDSKTGKPAAQDAVATLSDGAYTERMRPGGSDITSTGAFVLVSFAGGDERVGTYKVHIEKAGYQPWEKTGIVVERDVCHVIGVNLRADLIPVGN